MAALRTVVATFTFAVFAAAAGCGSSKGPERLLGDGDVGQGAAAGMAGTGGGAGGQAGTGGTLQVGGSAGAVTCGGTSEKAQLLPLDIYVMMDGSGSMTDTTSGGKTKWDSVKAALGGFVTDPKSTDIGVGIQYFPYKHNIPATCTANAQCGAFGPCSSLMGCQNAQSSVKTCKTSSDCGVQGPCVEFGLCSANTIYACFNLGTPCGNDPATGKSLGTCTKQPQACDGLYSCNKADFATPDVAITALPMGADAITASLGAHTPGGATPTWPALAGAIDYARQWAAKHPDHVTVVLLVTDGLPTTCAPTDIPSVAALAQAGVAGKPKVSTFVVGVFNATDIAQGAQTNLNTIAKAGGTTKATVISTTQNVTTQLLMAFEAIRKTALACEYKVPTPTEGELHLDMVNVGFVSGGGTAKTVPYVADLEHCDAVKGGWYYDVDPATGGTPTKIRACPATCTVFQGDLDGTVNIQLGCATQILDPK